VLFLIAIAIFRLYEEQILRLRDSFTIMQYLKEVMAEVLDADHLIRVALEVRWHLEPRSQCKDR
jgi:hypothetical protein